MLSIKAKESFPARTKTVVVKGPMHLSQEHVVDVFTDGKRLVASGTMMSPIIDKDSRIQDLGLHLQTLDAGRRTFRWMGLGFLDAQLYGHPARVSRKHSVPQASLGKYRIEHHRAEDLRLGDAECNTATRTSCCELKHHVSPISASSFSPRRSPAGVRALVHIWSDSHTQRGSKELSTFAYHAHGYPVTVLPFCVDGVLWRHIRQYTDDGSSHPVLQLQQPLPPRQETLAGSLLQEKI
ncbi:hypothetical protein EDD85DRAFT_830939 [Armillaria nabsnona]|nr:hypothetical protein EDD85DRAFT_830939 [Armillaria nabsnona]